MEKQAIERLSVSVSEKDTADVSVDEVDYNDKDEALKLVGLERANNYTEEQYNRVKRRLDWVISPLCMAAYGSQFLDKNVLNYASVMGLPITGQHYNLIALAFSLGFLFWVFPTMYICQKLRLGKYLGANIVGWGVIMMLHAVPKSFGPFFVLRVLLGMMESCTAPILVLIVSMFYKKEEQARRISWFYAMNGLTKIFGGVVAYGISSDEHAAILPYKVIYLLTGALAITVGIAVLIWMPDSPVHATFLTKEERIIAVERVRDDQLGTENKTIKLSQVQEALQDTKVWLIVLLTMLTSIPIGGLSNFGNLIIKSIGYSSRQALILSTPSGIADTLSALICGWVSDYTSERTLPIIMSLIPTLIGSGLLVGLKSTPDHKGVLLFAVYIISAYGSSIAIIYAYNASNTSGHTKKVTVSAMTLAAFCIGNIIGSEIFLPKDAPDYKPGKTAILILIGVAFFVCLIIRFVNARLNAQKRKGVQALKERHGWSDEELEKERQRHAFLDMTDKQNPYFVYTS